jgi:hypothetical protein
VLLEEDRHALDPRGQRREPIRERGKVPGEPGEQGIADRVHGRRAPLPDPVDLRVEQFAPDVVEGQFALDPHALGEPGRVDSLDVGLEPLCVGDLLDHRVARAVVQVAVQVVDAHVGREDRMILEHVAEVRLDQVPEPGVERTGGL